MGNRIYKEVMEAIRKNESIAVKTVFRGEEGSIAESLTRELVPVETSVDRKGVTHAGVRYEEQEEGTAVQEPPFSIGIAWGFKSGSLVSKKYSVQALPFESRSLKE